MRVTQLEYLTMTNEVRKKMQIETTFLKLCSRRNYSCVIYMYTFCICMHTRFSPGQFKTSDDHSSKINIQIIRLFYINLHS